MNNIDKLSVSYMLNVSISREIVHKQKGKVMFLLTSASPLGARLRHVTSRSQKLYARVFDPITLDDQLYMEMSRVIQATKKSAETKRLMHRYGASILRGEPAIPDGLAELDAIAVKMDLLATRHHCKRLYPFRARKLVVA
jgi:hypothetical protein